MPIGQRPMTEKDMLRQVVGRPGAVEKIGGEILEFGIIWPDINI